ncbi:MAG: hypothetical protein U0Q16_19935 [Bryobacteraceae bacterium]
MQPNENLIRENLDLLNQAVVLLERVPEDSHTNEVLGQKMGKQMRHVLEFYDCFLANLPSLHVDYSARNRDIAIENDRFIAAAKARELVDALAACDDVRSDGVVWVRTEEGEDFTMSSVGRELQTLASHTTHHFAIIALLLRMQGIEVDREFGVSQSTIQYWKKLEKVAA